MYYYKCTSHVVRNAIENKFDWSEWQHFDTFSFNFSCNVTATVVMRNKHRHKAIMIIIIIREIVHIIKSDILGTVPYCSYFVVAFDWILYSFQLLLNEKFEIQVVSYSP